MKAPQQLAGIGTIRPAAVEKHTAGDVGNGQEAIGSRPQIHADRHPQPMIVAAEILPGSPLDHRQKQVADQQVVERHAQVLGRPP